MKILRELGDVLGGVSPLVVGMCGGADRDGHTHERRSPSAHLPRPPHRQRRTTAQDVGYGLRQLADVVVRALSPGINDPTTDESTRCSS
nr:DUF2254 family protein [Rhodococcus rhodochrous]